MSAVSRDSAGLVWGALAAALRGDSGGVDVLVAAVPRSELRAVLSSLLVTVGREVAALSDDPESLQSWVREVAERHAAGGDRGE